MTARTRPAFVLTDAERQALDAARAKFVQWKRDWYDGGVSVDLAQLATLRKAARAFHKAMQPLMEDVSPIDGTRARLLVRMQQLQLHQQLQAQYGDQLTCAYITAMQIDDALASEVRQGVKRDRLAYVWVFHAADKWPGETPTASGRFGQALLEYRHRDTPAPGSVERIKDALTMWGQRRNG